MRIKKSLKPRVSPMLAAAAALTLALTLVADNGQQIVDKTLRSVGVGGVQQTASADTPSGKGFKSALFLFRLR